MAESTATANGIEICYETIGDGSNPDLLLIMGLGGQMIQWPDDFCTRLASRGYHVVRFDNRDVGLSTKFDEAGMPDLGAAMAGGGTPAYTLDEMAADAAGLLDALHIEAAHVVGVSMGGMVAQLLALDHAAKVLSLTSVMSHVGGEDAVPPTPEAMAAVLSERPTNREEVIATALQARKVIGSTGFPVDEDRIRDLAARSFDRCFNPPGFARQIAAIMTAPSRRHRLASVSVPACVIHGEADPLVPVDNGRRTAESLGDAELVVIPGMGHDLPEGAWDEIMNAIERTASKTVARA